MKSIESDYIKEFHYDSAVDFFNSISYGGELYRILNASFIFRGHYSDSYLLVPSALRESALDEFFPSIHANEKLYQTAKDIEYSQILQEYHLLQRFYNYSDKNNLRVPECTRMRDSVVLGYDLESIFIKERWLPRELWELAALAQHYGVPTRLLDWTTNINTALYFASRDYPITTRDSKENEGNMEIWALDTRVAILKEDKLPLQIIRPAYHGNPNLCAQEGVFTLWQIEKPIRTEGVPFFSVERTDRSPLDKHLVEGLKELKSETHPYLCHITIPKSMAPDIYYHLERIGHTAAKLFPGYGGVALAIRERALFDNYK